MIVKEYSTEGDEISRNNKNKQTMKRIADPSALMKAFKNLVNFKSTVDIYDRVISAIYAIELSDRNKEKSSA